MGKVLDSDTSNMEEGLADSGAKNSTSSVPEKSETVGLTESSGRAYAKMLEGQLEPFAADYLRNVSQFTYLPGRDEAMAVHRVAELC